MRLRVCGVMARFCANENFPLQTVQELRRLGHDVLTSLEAGNANRSVPDEEVLAFAAGELRVLLTQNRLHFLRLHRRDDMASRLHEQLLIAAEPGGKLFRVYRPG